jgi:hypothetical protein
MATAREVKALRHRLNEIRTSRDWHKQRAAALADKVRELKDGHKRGFEDGSKVATLTAYLAIKDFGDAGTLWLSNRMSAVARKSPPPNTAIDEAVTRSIIEHMRSYNPKRADEIAASFADFLAGDSNEHHG